MYFDRKSLEEILDSMVGWSRGVSVKLTDFRIGSKTRTLYEAVGIVIEEFYDRVYRAIRLQIEENLYGVLDFQKLPAAYASGIARFSRNTPADQTYYVPAGTTIKTVETPTQPSLFFRTLEDIGLATGQSYVDALVVCTEAGSKGNIDANSLTLYVAKPNGFNTVTNLNAFQNGTDEETKAEQKARFQKYIRAQAKGVLHAIMYGAETAVVKDANGLVVERVVEAKAFEYLPERLGEVDVYLWNGATVASEDLITAANKVLYGYYDEAGTPIYGYKPAGVIAYVYSAVLKDIRVKAVVTPEGWTTTDDLKTAIEKEIDRFFSSIKIGETLIQTAIEAKVKGLDGVNDVKLYLSTNNGTTWVDTNVAVQPYEICRIVKPILYE